MILALIILALDLIPASILMREIITILPQIILVLDITLMPLNIIILPQIILALDITTRVRSITTMNKPIVTWR
jgi:hypothetical protein